MDFCGFDLTCWGNFFSFYFWQPFISEFLATLIGAGLGVWGALWLSGRERREDTLKKELEEKERKKIILESLENELETNQMWVEIWMDKFKKSPDTMPLQILRIETWRALSDGGELELIKSTMLVITLANAYSQVNIVNQLVRMYYDLKLLYFYNPNMPSEPLHDSCKNLLAQLYEVYENLKFALDDIEKELELI